MNLTEIANNAQKATRILLSSSKEDTARLIVHIIDFLGENIDFVSEEETRLNNNDFIILSSNNLKDAEIFNPNIVLMTEVLPHTETLINHIVSGGILVYPSNAILLETQMIKTEHFFRKIPFSTTPFVVHEDTYQIDTVLGEVPLNTKNEDLIASIEGVRLFCQQLGIMEEEFYEAVMNFE